MSLNRGSIVIFLSFLLLTLCANAQTNSLTAEDLSTVNVDKLSDAEITAYYTKAKQSGLSEQNIYRFLEERGLPQEEIDKLQNRIFQLNSDTTEIKSSTEVRALKQDKKNRYLNQDANLIPSQTSKNDLTIFGSEIFATNSLVFEPNLRIPTPAGYILGPDDELIINVFGFSEKNYNVTVNEEGNIYIPQVGPITVSGLNIEQATTKIKSKLASTIYKAINSGQTTVQISLGKIRSIRVTVIGESKKPGTYTVSSLTTLFNLLYLCGGPSDLGSYRKIELIRGNEIKRTVDLYAFLLKGDQKDNMFIERGGCNKDTLLSNKNIIEW